MVLEMLSKHTVKGKSPLAGNTVSVELTNERPGLGD